MFFHTRRRPKMYMLRIKGSVHYAVAVGGPIVITGPKHKAMWRPKSWWLKNLDADQQAISMLVSV